jgi:hypothetical protein
MHFFFENDVLCMLTVHPYPLARLLLALETNKRSTVWPYLRIRSSSVRRLLPHGGTLLILCGN